MTRPPRAGLGVGGHAGGTPGDQLRRQERVLLDIWTSEDAVKCVIVGVGVLCVFECMHFSQGPIVAVGSGWVAICCGCGVRLYLMQAGGRLRVGAVAGGCGS
jgi:hypothetical protein